MKNNITKLNLTIGLNIILISIIIINNFFLNDSTNIQSSKIGHIEYMEQNNLSCNDNKLVQTSWDIFFTVKTYPKFDIWGEFD